MRVLLFLASLIILNWWVLMAEGAELTASEVLAKSDAAYAAVKTYVGVTTVRAKTDMGAMKLEQAATAKVTFMRPGKIRIEGKAAGFAPGMEGPAYGIVSDGKTTWKSLALMNNGAYSEVKNIAMAGVAGVALGAAEGIPAALMKSEGAWTARHDPFAVPSLSETKLAGHETIDSADCYKLVAIHPELGKVTLWIDAKSFLLRQMTKELTGAQLAAAVQKASEAMKGAGPALPANMAAIKSKSDMFSFAIEKVDGSVDAKLFTNPMKK